MPWQNKMRQTGPAFDTPFLIYCGYLSFSKELKMDTQLFKTLDERFSIESHGVLIDCQRLDIPNYVAFRIEFSSKRNPLIIVRAAGMNVPFFWTSIPEGRQREAEGVGKLIEEYLANKNQ